jgi:hypothetical protein
MSIPKSVVTTDACARLMLSQVRALQRQHRAGINPHHGQLEALFDTADLLERQFESADGSDDLPRCATRDCPRPPNGGNHAWAGLCYSCAGKAIAAAIQDGSWQPPPLAMRP